MNLSFGYKASELENRLKSHFSKGYKEEEGNRDGEDSKAGWGGSDEWG